MNRREFLKTAGLVALNGLPAGTSTGNFQTKHLIWIMNGNGSRKMDWYGNPSLSPNYARLAKEGFVYEESHNDTVSNHRQSWAEALTGNSSLRYPTPLHYVRHAYGDSATNYWFINNGVTSSALFREKTLPVSLMTSSLDVSSRKQIVGLTSRENSVLKDFLAAMSSARLSEFNLKNAPIPREPFISDAVGLAVIPHIMKEFKPRMLIYRQAGHDAGHGNHGYVRKQTGCFEYEKVCRTADEQIGRIFDFIRNDPYFSRNTTIVIRPEFGRDDEVNVYGELNHSEGYYQSHRSAEIWWGPDIQVGVDRSVKNRRDLAPSITALFNVEAPYALGQVHTEMFRSPIPRAR